MNRPGDSLRAWASRWCCPDTMAAIIDPMIADLQLEHARARRSGRMWRSRLIRLSAAIMAIVSAVANARLNPAPTAYDTVELSSWRVASVR